MAFVVQLVVGGLHWSIYRVYNNIKLDGFSVGVRCETEQLPKKHIYIKDLDIKVSRNYLLIILGIKKLGILNVSTN